METKKTEIDSKNFEDSLYAISDIIRNIEAAINKKNILKLEYEHHMSNNVENIFLSIKKQRKKSKTGHLRLYIRIDSIEVNKPFSDLPITLKIEYVKYIAPFLRAFKVYQVEKTNALQEAAAEAIKELCDFQI